MLRQSRFHDTLTKGFKWATFIASTPRWTFSRDIRRMRFMHHHAKRIDWGADVTQAAETPAVYVYTLALFLFPSATINTTVLIRLPVFHALWRIAMTMTRCRKIRHATQDSPRDPVNRRHDAGGGEHRNRTRDYTAMRLRLSAAKILWRMDAAPFLFTVTNTENWMLTYKSEKESSLLINFCSIWGLFYLKNYNLTKEQIFIFYII